MNYILTAIAFFIGIFVGVITITWFTVIPDSEVTPMVILYAAGTVIALCALGGTIWHSYNTQRHNKLTVKPHLVLNSLMRPDPAYFRIFISNVGLGPAFIKSVAIYFRDTQINATGTELANEVHRRMLLPFSNKGPKHAINDTTVIKAGEDFDFAESVEIKGFPNYRVLQETVNNTRKLVRFEIVYTSIYGDEFTLNDTLG